MSHLPYSHAIAPPLTVVMFRAIVRWLRRLIGPALSRLMPAGNGRHWITVSLWLLGLLVQVILLVILKEVVELCISLFELWAFLAGEFVDK